MSRQLGDQDTLTWDIFSNSKERNLIVAQGKIVVFRRSNAKKTALIMDEELNKGHGLYGNANRNVIRKKKKKARSGIVGKCFF